MFGMSFRIKKSMMLAVIGLGLLTGCGRNMTIEEAIAKQPTTEAQTEAVTEAVTEPHVEPSFEGVSDRVILEGDKIDLGEGVTAKDGKGEELSFVVKAEDFDANTQGTYTITYMAKDSDGCEVTATCTVTVDPKVYTSTSGQEILGVRSTDVWIGDAFDALEGISLSKDFAADAQIVVDMKDLDLATEGTYKISYHATNLRGQTVYAYRTIHVYPQPVIWGPYGGTATWDVAGHMNQPYLVAVNRMMNTVTVYGKDENNNYTNPVIAFVCSVGLPGMDTITGTYTTTNRYNWRLLIDGSYGRYAIRINGGYLFHSVPYFSENNNDLMYDEFNKLGNPASHGCIRMQVSDVYWLYCNCPEGFTTVIYDDAFAGPLGKPNPHWIDTSDEALRGWDPTDPEYGSY